MQYTYSFNSMSSESVSPVSIPSSGRLFGGLELGGTSIKFALSLDSPTNVIYQTAIPCETPDKSMQTAVEFFRPYSSRLASIGVASFGPVDLDFSSPHFGFITSTPKLAWQNSNILGRFKQLNVPTGWETDVNAAAMGEFKWGGHEILSNKSDASLVYVTVGTGIGAGVICSGRPIHGAMHPEAGHMVVRRHERDQFAGSCPFHGDCLEGLATANACAARAGVNISELASLPDSHETFEFAAYYLAQLCANFAMFLSPSVIVLGGGLLHRSSLFPAIRKNFLSRLNNYIQAKTILDADNYIVGSKFDCVGSKTSSGAVGAMELARRIADGEDKNAAEYAIELK